MLKYFSTSIIDRNKERKTESTNNKNKRGEIEKKCDFSRTEGSIKALTLLNLQVKWIVEASLVFAQ